MFAINNPSQRYLFKSVPLIRILSTKSPTMPGDIEDTDSTLGSERSLEEGNGNLFQYSYLENPMDWDLGSGSL